MSNMSAATVRPKSIVTKTVSHGAIASKSIASNNNPCCTKASKGDSCPGVPDRVHSGSRTVYGKGF